MFDISIQGNLLKRSFDSLEKEKLAKYVYALRDPRDGKIFYVGQGQGNRVFDHFYEADTCLKKQKMACSKTIRILDIWKNEEDVDWFIVAHGLESGADSVETAVLDTLSQSQNGPTLNGNNGPKSSILMQEDIALLGAIPVNPSLQMHQVFIFPVKNGLAQGKSAYEATRSAWYVKKAYQNLPAYAVGIRDGISIGSFEIKSWQSIGSKSEFNGVVENSLLNKSWVSILSKVKGYWQRGNYVIVEFDGNGKCKIVRGAGQESIYFDL